MRTNTVLIGLLFMLLFDSTFAKELIDDEKAIISSAIKENLIDPDSAKFKWMELVGEQPQEYCGVVNSKNRLGGYAGDAPFLAFLAWDQNTLVIAFPLKVGSADWDSSDSLVVVKLCSEKGYKNLYLAK